jgi:hypothetical protein
MQQNASATIQRLLKARNWLAVAATVLTVIINELADEPLHRWINHER